MQIISIFQLFYDERFEDIRIVESISRPGDCVVFKMQERGVNVYRDSYIEADTVPSQSFVVRNCFFAVFLLPRE